ncbi:hypothetical protein Leryth_007197 [Lithospermum erythrorhizon]|nr:hypothetical protein Leryth_007197 [Lithospermum erythrorhizon]
MSLKRGNYHEQLLSELAIGDQHGENSPYFDGWKAYDTDPFHPTKNPGGVIQMGLAENQLSFGLIEEWIKKNPRASICTNEGAHNFKDIAIFQDYHGLPEFRSAVANFMGKVRGDRVKFDPDRIVMAGGATGANETIMFCLADRGDAFLVPSPYYPAFNRDLRWRTGVQLLPIPCESSNNFQITLQSLQKTYENAIKNNIKVKGLILTNPSNPLGTTLTRETLKSLVSFINSKRIHIVCDEIYAATVFTSPDFTSVAEVIEEVECDKDLIHIVYSLSKDMGLPGFRVGIVYSFNDVVVSCARKMSSFGLVSSQTQYFLATMLSDDEFVSKFLKESSTRLGNRHGIFTEGLEEVGITCLRSNAGLFCWMDLRKLLKDSSFEAEMELWRVIINEVKLNVSPGSSFECLEPGWFRVCFANMDDETMGIALKRIKMFVGKAEEGEAPPAPRWRKDLRLSFSSTSRMILDNEGGAMLPHMMSPHSPMPHSPLVLAQT